MWNPNDHHDRSHENYPGPSPGVYESPIISHGRAMSQSTGCVTAPYTPSYIAEEQTRPLTHKSTYSTLPEVTNSPNPYYYSSPIACDSKSDVSRCWAGSPVTSTSDGSADIGMVMAAGAVAGATAMRVGTNTGIGMGTNTGMGGGMGVGTTDTEKEMHVSANNSSRGRILAGAVTS